MSNGINQNATSYTTAAVQEEGLLAPCSGHGSASGRAVPHCSSWFLSTPGHRGAGPGPHLHWVWCHGGQSVPSPAPRHEEQNGCLGAMTAPVPLCSCAPVPLCPCAPVQAHHRRHGPLQSFVAVSSSRGARVLVCWQHRVSPQQKAGTWVPLGLCPATASGTPECWGDACQLSPAAAPGHGRFLTPVGPKGWPCPCQD